MIFADIKKRLIEYDEVIADDKTVMTQLGMDKYMSEIQLELADRLAGVVIVDTGDDQLMGEASKL